MGVSRGLLMGVVFLSLAACGQTTANAPSAMPPASTVAATFAPSGVIADVLPSSTGGIWI